MTKLKKQRAEDLATAQDSKSLLDQIKSLRDELLRSKEQYEEQIGGLEQTRGLLEQKVSLALLEKTRLERNVNEERAKQQLELAQCKERMAKYEAAMRDYEANYSKKTDYGAEESKAKEQLTRAKEDIVRLRDELTSHIEESKEAEEKYQLLKVPNRPDYSPTIGKTR